MFLSLEKKREGRGIIFKGKEREKSEVQLEAWGACREKFFVREFRGELAAQLETLWQPRGEGGEGGAGQ